MDYKLLDKFYSLIGGTMIFLFILDIFRLIVPFTHESIITFYTLGGAIIGGLLYWLIKGDLERIF